MAGAVGRDVGPAVILDPEEKKSFKFQDPNPAPYSKPPQGNPLSPAATGVDNLLLQVRHIFVHIGQSGFNHTPWRQDSCVCIFRGFISPLFPIPGSGRG